MDESKEVQIVDTEHFTLSSLANDLYIARKNAYSTLLKGIPEVTIFVVAFNRLEKTKRCVESILKHTRNIDYELLLVDNGSHDKTLEYFKSVQYAKKRIIRITKNLGSQYALNLAMQLFSGRYFVQVTNDVIVTENWLSNLLCCMDSDPKIGMAAPGSSNISNCQEIPLVFSSYEEMQEKASAYNQSDPKKWEERLRLMTVVLVVKRELIELAGMIDRGFYHDFGDDDFSVRIRRAGYKLMVCMDTFVHHDHDIKQGEDKDKEEFLRSLEAGRKNFTDKYYGLDSWSEMSNFEEYIEQSFPDKKVSALPRILGVDAMCGQPILQIKNELRRRGIMNVEMSAFTTEAKYYSDLKTVCDDVVCDRIEGLLSFFEHRSFDYIVLGKPINTYSEFPTLLRILLGALKPSGTLFLKLSNTQDVVSYFTMMGQSFPLEEFVTQVSLEQFNQILELLGAENCNILSVPHQATAQLQSFLRDSLEKSCMVNDTQFVYNRLMTKEYAYCITK